MGFYVWYFVFWQILPHPVSESNSTKLQTTEQWKILISNSSCPPSTGLGFLIIHFCFHLNMKCALYSYACFLSNALTLKYILTFTYNFSIYKSLSYTTFEKSKKSRYKIYTFYYCINHFIYIYIYSIVGVKIAVNLWIIAGIDLDSGSFKRKGRNDESDEKRECSHHIYVVQ